MDGRIKEACKIIRSGWLSVGDGIVHDFYIFLGDFYIPNCLQ